MYEKFAKLLEAQGVSAYKVSKETGISQATLSQWKNGQYELKADKLQKIADYFNVPLSYFYEEKHEMTAKEYYVIRQTGEMVQRYFERPECRMLFDATKDMQPEDVEKVVQMIKVFKGEI